MAPAISDGDPLSGHYLVNPRERIITASLAINVDDVSLLYAATSEGIELVSYTCTIGMLLTVTYHYCFNYSMRCQLQTNFSIQVVSGWTLSSSVVGLL